MVRQKVLVVEDDAAIRQGVVDALDFGGYDTIQAPNGIIGLEKATSHTYDLLLLDLVLPGKDGLDILKEVRAKKPTTPVIILTARGEESDRVRGLQLGADDYVVKPFSVKELLARVAAVLRRSPERPAEISKVKFEGGVADLARFEVRFENGKRDELSELEASLLRYLASNAGRAISREELMGRVWNLNPRGGETRTIDMLVARLREKLHDDSSHPRVILTVRGKGYMFAARE